MWVICSFSSNESRRERNWAEGARRSSLPGTLCGQWRGGLVLGNLVMLSPHPICCTCVPSTTHSSFSSILEPRVPENQVALHIHSPYSQRSGPPLCPGKGPVPLPAWLARGYCICQDLLFRVLCILVWIYLHTCMNVWLYICTHIYVCVYTCMCAHVHKYG